VEEFRRHSGLHPSGVGWPRWRLTFAWSSAAALVTAAALLLAVHERGAESHRRPVTAAAASDWASRFASDGTSEFLPLPNAARLAPNEDVNLVRMEVPRSAMIAVGFAVPPDRAEERVQADVVLGSDGWARAVRFLDE
jgi:hypothetical protein